MNCYFKGQEQSLLGVASLHQWSSVADAMWARSLVEYMSLRGAVVELDDIEAPETEDWGDVVKSIECIIRGKQDTYQLVLELYDMALRDNTDPHLQDFIEVNFARPMVNFLRKVGILYSEAKLACRDGDSVGVYQFDKDVERNLLKIILVNKLVRPDKFSCAY